MTAVKILWGPAAIGPLNAATSAYSGQALSDADNAVAWAFNVPKDGSITEVGYLVTARTGTNPAYNVGIVTLGTAGEATTSAYGGSAITASTPTGTGWVWVTLSTPATANAGDWAAVHIYPSGTAPDASNNVAVEYIGIADGGIGMRYTTGWAYEDAGNAMAVKYSGGEIYGYALSTNTGFLQTNTGTTPDETGCKFQLPATMACTGARVCYPRSGLAGAFDVILYSAADAVLASASVTDKDFADNSDYANVFWDSVSLSAATDYRLIVKPTSASNVYMVKWTFESATARAYLPEGASWQWTERTDAGAWTDTATAITPIGLWVSDITFSTTAGGGGEYAYIG